MGKLFKYQNDNERRLWVLNDEYLYNQWRRSRCRNNLRKFLQENRTEIDEFIYNQLHKYDHLNHR